MEGLGGGGGFDGNTIHIWRLGVFLLVLYVCTIVGLGLGPLSVYTYFFLALLWRLSVMNHSRACLEWAGGVAWAYRMSLV